MAQGTRRDEREWKRDEVIQLGTGENFKEPFWAKLAIIEEVMLWGVQVRIETFEGDAYLRIPWHFEFYYVGQLQLVRRSAEEVGNGGVA